MNLPYIAGCLKLAADRLRRDNEDATMKPRSASELAAYYADYESAPAREIPLGSPNPFPADPAPRAVPALPTWYMNDIRNWWQGTWKR